MSYMKRANASGLYFTSLPYTANTSNHTVVEPSSYSPHSSHRGNQTSLWKKDHKMKLLGWMHRKFRQTNNEGQQSFDDQQYYSKQNYDNKPLRQTHKDYSRRKSFAGLEAARIEEGYYEEESSTEISSALFDGFLAIGTLGSDSITTNPPTPTFTTSFENITEKETEVTENELRLINDELEKVLGAEAREDGCSFSSGRNSHVSTGRSSHGSTITLSGKPLEETNESESTICPLQGYLFGSAVESQTTTVPKKELRTSLGELFQKSKLADENYGGKYGRGEKKSEKDADKSAVQLMKKILKKKSGPSKGSSAAAGGTDDAASAENKFHKILHRFHKKVHPENSKSTQPEKLSRNETNNIPSEMGYNIGDRMLPDRDIIIYPQSGMKRSMRRHKSQSNPPQFAIGGSDSNGNRECWIKTDADYLVLEL